jgi:hypothetical protein
MLPTNQHPKMHSYVKPINQQINDPKRSPNLSIHSTNQPNNQPFFHPPIYTFPEAHDMNS